MKFFSVFVLCFYVHTSYSYYVKSTVSTDSMTQENNSVQPSPVQQEYKVGPGFPVPYQAAQIDPSGQNNGQQIPQAPNGGSPPHISAAKYVASSPYLRTMYEKSFPTTRYTIVHPDGTIEHTNELHVVTSRYPKYVMVKATDILAQAQQQSLYRTPLTPSQNTQPTYSSKPITTTNQKLEWTSTNSFDKSRYPNLNTQKLEVDSTWNPNNLNVASSNVAASNELVNQQNIQGVNEERKNTFVTGSIPSVTQVLREEVVASNPLPIYPTTSVSEGQTNYKQSSESSTANENVSSYQSTARSVGNVISASTVNSQASTIDQTISTKPTDIQTPIDLDKKEILPVILPTVQQDSSKQDIQTATIAGKPLDNEISRKVSIVEEPITSTNIKSTNVPNDTSSSPNLATVAAPNTITDIGPPKDAVNENVQPVDSSQISTITSSTTTLEDNSNTPSDSNKSSPTFGNGAPLNWFTLSEDRVWEAIRNNTSNVYFFFLPPKPKQYKETRKTIFPNGTTVEETIITDIDKGEDGMPKVIQNSTIIYGNETKE